MAEYERLCSLDGVEAPTLEKSLLEIPQDDQEFKRMSLRARPLELRESYHQWGHTWRRFYV